MSLLPELERELQRVARLPMADDGTAPKSAVMRTARRGRRLSRPTASSVVVIAAVFVAIAIGGLFVAVLHNGGTGQPSTPGPAGRGSPAFPDAPRTQPNNHGVVTGVCPLAPPNRYLPRWSGCVTVLRADLTGDARPDLILLYSRLSHRRAGQLGLTQSSSKMYAATRAGALLKVLSAPGTGAIDRIRDAKAAAIVARAHVNDDPGDELFIEVSQISSGANAVAYGFQDGRLTPAGVTLAYGGDSASRAGFDCLAGNPPRLVQRTFELVGPTIRGRWTETDVTYAWHGPRLEQIGKRTFQRHGQPRANEIGIGSGCRTGISPR